MYALILDIDEDYDSVENILFKHEFSKKNQYLYIGKKIPTLKADCITAVKDLNDTLPWFKNAVKSIHYAVVNDIDELTELLK